MPVRRRTDSTPDAWLVDFRAGGKRYRYTVRAETESDAIKLEAGLRTRVASGGLKRKIKSRYTIRWAKLLDNARTRAQRRGERFGLTKSDMDRIVARARNCCELTGLPFSWKWHPGRSRRALAPSLDRIQPELGYTPENVRLVCVAVNIAVNEWGEETFATIASAYLAKQSS